MPQPIDLLEAIRDGITKATVARDREIARLAQRAKALEVAAGSLRDALMALLPPTTAKASTSSASGGSATRVHNSSACEVCKSLGGRPPARKRAPVKATEGQTNVVRIALSALTEPVTIKQLRGAVSPLGPKVISAALYKIAGEGYATVDDRGRWSATRPEADND